MTKTLPKDFIFGGATAAYQAAGGYGAHREMLPEFDLVILAPQVASNFEDMKAETDKLGIKLAKTEGAQYIKLTRDGKGALAFVQAQFD